MSAFEAGIQSCQVLDIFLVSKRDNFTFLKRNSIKLGIFL